MNPTELLKHHVTGAIERGEKSPIVERPVKPVAVTLDSGGDSVEILARFDTVPEAEAYIAGIAAASPADRERVESGVYGIDAPEGFALDQLTAEVVATEFINVIREWLSPEQLAEVVRRNRTREYRHCCATHDFCDANMAMLEAFTLLLGYQPDVICDDPDESKNHVQRLWNAAWEIAQQKEFSADA